MCFSRKIKKTKSKQKSKNEGSKLHEDSQGEYEGR